MRKNIKFGDKNWEQYIPKPVLEQYPQYIELYKKAWSLAFDHVKDIPGMPQSPYMDEALCETQVWIWDSCFMSFFCKYAREVFPGIETLNNFYEVLYGDGHLPSIIPKEEEPTWTHRVVGEPYEIQVHIADNPPLFAWAEYENALMCGDKEYIKEMLYQKQYLQKHYEWIEGLKERVKPDGVFLKTYMIAEENGYHWEGGSSGMDNTPRGRKGEKANCKRPNDPDLLWVDAICQQALSAKMIAKLFALVDDKENQKLWEKRHEQKCEIINRLYWDAEDKFYYDIRCNDLSFCKVMTIASCWAMTAGACSEEQANALIAQLENPQTLGGDVPLLSLSRSDSDFNTNGEYWRGALWLPTAYATLVGMKNYKKFSKAHEAALKIVEHMYQTYVTHEPHTIWECYSPTEPKPAFNDKGNYCKRDFCGWSALGPISVLIEHVLGFHTIDAFQNKVEWEKPKDIKGKIGIQNLRFGEIVTDIEANETHCSVSSNRPYTLAIRGKEYQIQSGENQFAL